MADYYFRFNEKIKKYLREEWECVLGKQLFFIGMKKFLFNRIPD